MMAFKVVVVICADFSNLKNVVDKYTNQQQSTASVENNFLLFQIKLNVFLTTHMKF